MSYSRLHLKHSLTPLAVFAGVLFLDQIIKNLSLHSGKFQKNYSALFGLEINKPLSFLILLIFVISSYVYLKNKRSEKFFLIPFALMTSGIISNLIDKINYNFIIDYIDFFNIFIFNFADLAILLGALFFIWRIIKE